MILGLLLVVPGLLAIALIWIQLQDARIRSWRQTSGRIVSSRAEARTVRTTQFRNQSVPRHAEFTTEDMLATTNVAHVTYTFDVAGKAVIGTRIDLSVDGAQADVPATLRKYPQGQAVTVFYDPADPTQCVLERDDPKNIRAGWFALAVLVALIVAGVYGGNVIADVVRGAISRPDLTPLVMIFGVFALVLAGFASMIWRKGRAMRSWPATPGTIVESAIATTTLQTSAGNWSRVQRKTLYGPRVVYRYSVGGMTFDGDNIGTIIKASTPNRAAKRIAHFPLDAVVTVFYNPDLPTESTLDRGVSWFPAGLAAIAVLFVLAALAVAAGLVHAL